MAGVAIYRLISSEEKGFHIDLNSVVDNRAAQMSFWERVEHIALPTILEYGKILVASAGEAFYINISYIPDTLQFFLQVAPTSPEGLLFMFGAWVVLHIVGFVTITIYVFIKNINAMPQALLGYADPLIDTQHIKTKDTTIDVSHVPDEITVSTLVEVFDKINFTRPDLPGYMSEGSRTEDHQVYTSRELRQSLEDNFVRRVNAREAFLGTPAAWNIAMLSQFYSQIESAVRYSLHKVVNDCSEFIGPYLNELAGLESEYQEYLTKNTIPSPGDRGYDAYARLLKGHNEYISCNNDLNQAEFVLAGNLANLEREYQQYLKSQEILSKEDPDHEAYARLLKGHEKYLEYNGLLQARARVAIDMAIAGNHCGARYMGDSMDTYFFHKGEIVGQTLEDELKGVLAKRREEMARRHIQQHLGAGTHHFAAYMANLGGLLGIPGTENVIEQLGGWNFNRDAMLGHFFREYTPEFIRSSIQGQFSSSQQFRERIYDWLKDHAGDWIQGLYQQKQQTILGAVQDIESQESENDLKPVEILTGLISSGKVVKQDSPLPDHKTQWSDFLDEIVSFDSAKEYLDQEMGTAQLGVAAKMTARNQWKNLMTDPVLAPALQTVVTDLLEGKNPQVDNIKAYLQVRNWMGSVNRILNKNDCSPISPDTLERCCRQEVSFNDVLASHLEAQRGVEFLDNLDPDRAHKTSMEAIMAKISQVRGENAKAWAAAVNETLTESDLKPLSINDLVRCFHGNVSIEQLLAPHIPHTLDPKVLEWVLVAHGILHPPTTQAQRIE